MIKRPSQLLPVIVLLAIVLHQLYRVHEFGLSPWKGGGFGMFAVVDRPNTRVVAAFCREASGADCAIDLKGSPTTTPRGVLKNTFRAQYQPTTEALRRLAHEIRAATLVPAGFRSRYAMQQVSSRDDIPWHPMAARDTITTLLYNVVDNGTWTLNERRVVGAVSLQVRRITFDVKTNHVKADVVASYER